MASDAGSRLGFAGFNVAGSVCGAHQGHSGDRGDQQQVFHV
jgi:hypothetical protein